MAFVDDEFPAVDRDMPVDVHRDDDVVKQSKRNLVDTPSLINGTRYWNKTRQRLHPFLLVVLLFIFVAAALTQMLMDRTSPTSSVTTASAEPRGLRQQKLSSSSNPLYKTSELDKLSRAELYNLLRQNFHPVTETEHSAASFDDRNAGRFLPTGPVDPYSSSTLTSLATQQHRRLVEQAMDTTSENHDSITSNIVGAVLTVLAIAVAAGLFLGLMTLDILDLQIIARSSIDEDEIMYAQTLMPVIKDRHRLLVTLLLMNTLAYETLPIFLDRLMPGWIAILLSTTLILVVGEILPSGKDFSCGDILHSCELSHNSSDTIFCISNTQGYLQDLTNSIWAIN
jgi:hypothetical protein